MPRVCTACAHAERDSVDHALIRGEPMRRIAAEHQLSETAVRRHAARHIPAALVNAGEAREACRGERLLGEVMALQGKALELVAQAEAEGDVRAAVVALKEARECVEMRARIGAELTVADAKTAEPRTIRSTYVSPKREQENAPETLDARPGTLAERLDDREE